jgi:hypothetical protein
MHFLVRASERTNDALIGGLLLPVRMYIDNLDQRPESCPREDDKNSVLFSLSTWDPSAGPNKTARATTETAATSSCGGDSLFLVDIYKQ